MYLDAVVVSTDLLAERLVRELSGVKVIRKLAAELALGRRGGTPSQLGGSGN